MLKLGGSVRGKTVVQFLKELGRHMGLAHYPVEKHFDIVVGSDIGMSHWRPTTHAANQVGAYFVQTIFLEDWSLADCAYHIPRLADPKLDSKRSVVSFGKGLEWDLTTIKHFNTPEATLVVQNRVFYNADQPSSATHELESTDIAVRCQGTWSSDPQSAAHHLFASLFYIELMDLPKFYAARERARVHLHCRVPPGPALLELVSGLYRSRAQVYYRADDSNHVSDLLVTSAALARCRTGERFARAFEIQVGSMASSIDVRIDGLGGPEYISNCPYELQKLVQDQGLDCVFGRKDHRDLERAEMSSFAMFEAIDWLSRALEGVIGLWATRLSAEP